MDIGPRDHGMVCVNLPYVLESNTVCWMYENCSIMSRWPFHCRDYTQEGGENKELNICTFYLCKFRS